MVIPAGFEVRSLNRRTGTLERCLCSFRANELRSLAFGTEAHQSKNRSPTKGNRFFDGDPGGIRTHGLSLRSFGWAIVSEIG